MSMRKNEKPIVIMDFSGIYGQEQFYEGEEAAWVEVQDIPGTNCYCDQEAMEKLRERIAEFPPEGIHFIDSGNYHYMSRIWLEKIKEPFRLLVFDNHTDMQLPAFGGLLSCGGWIAAALEEIRELKEVILVGPDEEAYSLTEEAHRERVRFLSREALGEMEEPQLETFFGQLSPDLPLYISVDKDILKKGEAHTTWSQGETTLETLLFCLKTVKNSFEKRDGRICAVDICGECDFGEGESSKANDRANRALLELMRERK